MAIRQIITAAALLLVAAPAIASPSVKTEAQDVPPKGLVTAQDYYEGCLAAAAANRYDVVPEQHRAGAMACMSAAGVFLQYGPQMGICRAESTTNRDAALAFVKLVNRGPHLMTMHFQTVMQRALLEAYPCQGPYVQGRNYPIATGTAVPFLQD